MARRARRSPLFAPIALFLLVGFAALAGMAASRVLPTKAAAVTPRPSEEHVHGTYADPGYPGAATRSPHTAELSPTPYSEPRVIRSHNGVLRTTFTPDQGSSVINGQTYTGTWTYTGTFPGPTLHVNPGDTIRIKFINKLGQNTNLHFHGFRVSPAGIHDNVLRTIFPAATSKMVGPKKSVKIVIQLPKDHEQGLYWYHPHFHGNTEAQVYPGLEGMIVVGDTLEHFPWLHHIRERVMSLQAPALGANGALIPLSQLKSLSQLSNLVNGHYQPTLTIHPGELQLWRMANMTAGTWYKLSLGGQKLYVIGEDGNPVPHVWSSRTLLMPPAKRFEFLVRGPAVGNYQLVSQQFNQGHTVFPQVTLLNLVSQGKPVKKLRVPQVISPAQAEQQTDELKAHVYRRRVITFSIVPVPNSIPKFEINGRLFNPNRVDQKVRLNTVEEWLLRNTSPEDHPFHIHTNDFLVERINGRGVPIHGFQDVVRIPREQNGKPGTVLIRQEYRTFQGEAVFHCHILFHEDNAMMATIKYLPPSGPPA